MNKLKKLIIIIIIFILIIVTILMLFKNKDDNKMNSENVIEESEEVVLPKDDNGYCDVADFNIFYSVMNSLNKYVDIVKYNENFSIDEEINNENINEENLSVIYMLLDESYKKNNSINLSNIKKYIYEMNENTILIPVQMKVKYGSNINTYILKSYLVTEKIETKFFVIRVDNKNQAFSLEFINNNTENIEGLNILDKDERIEKNDYNSFEIEMVSEEQEMQSYFENYKNLMLYCPEITYNYYLDKEYKEKRFGTLENYERHINNNIDELKDIELDKYLIENDNNETLYVCMDKYQNTYIFNISSVFQYKIKLDTYTIPSDKFLNTYNNSGSQNKVMMNVDKFVMMLNSRNYDSVYKLLDNNFKNNNFASKENFETYMRERFQSHYKVEYKSFEEYGNNVFGQEIDLVDIDNMEKLDLNIIIKLEDGINFSMSFGIN